MKTDEELIELRENLDDPLNFERPVGFQLDQEWQRFSALVSEVWNHFGVVCEHDPKGAVQDASYLADIRLPADLLKESEREKMATNNTSAYIIVSNFGHLAAVGFETSLKPGVLAQIVKILEKQGYDYVPEGLLQRPYTGQNVGVSSGPNWYGRFFDYS